MSSRKPTVPQEVGCATACSGITLSSTGQAEESSRIPTPYSHFIGNPLLPPPPPLNSSAAQSTSRRAPTSEPRAPSPWDGEHRSPGLLFLPDLPQRKRGAFRPL